MEEMKSLMEMLVSQSLRYWASAKPDAIAVVDGHTGESLTYAALDQATDTLAWHLDHMGVGATEVVAFAMTEKIPVITLLLALAKIGAAWTPLNPHAPSRDWFHQVHHAQAKSLVYDDPALISRLSEDCGGSWPPNWSWRILSLSDSPRSPLPFVRDVPSRQKAGILYTSGTTGVPKGAWHTHESLWGWNHCLLQSLGMHQDDCLINPYPLFHMGGIGFTLASLQAGSTVVLETPFDAEHFTSSITRFHATIALMVPTMVQALLDLGPHWHLQIAKSPLRQLVTTSAPLMTETRHAIEKTWPNLMVSVLYSATEAIFTVLRHEKSDAHLCVGRVAFGTELLILGSDQTPCAVGQPGTIYARGLSVFAGYHRSPDQFGSWYANWFTCKDIGYQDRDGYLYLVDREKDLINSGGEKISSLEIENILRLHPGVKEAAVVGIPDRYWGERIHAVVVRRSEDISEHQLLTFARQHLTAFKVPKSVTFTDNLPKTDTGKILKRALRDAESGET